jgi:2-C-methyl-D-erythritol 2,4-cyclodiphosphate synthase
MTDSIGTLRVGTGFDAHAFSDGRRLVLGGVVIDHERGLAGHSDADVLVHAIIDAILGASGLGDIGGHFPDTDPAYKGISSILLLERVYLLLVKHHVSIINIDSVIICQKPKIGPHVDSMKQKISAALGGLDVSRIGIKGKTTEKLGFTGREEGIAVQTVALVALGL